MSENGDKRLIVQIKKKLGDFLLDVNFQVGTKKLALLGPSGAGKTLVLRCIAGVETPDEGRIILDGRILFDSAKKINLKPQQRKIGYMFQDYALFPTMTVEENIKAGMGRISDAKRLREYIDTFKLSGLEKHLPAQLSGGQKQRVAMARMIANNPEAILLDEPFSAMDNELKRELCSEMSAYLQSANIPVVFVSHNLDEVNKMCDTVINIREGKLQEAEEAKENFKEKKMSGFTHFDNEGNAVMVDVHEKADTYRIARAAGEIYVNQECYEAIKNGGVKKGDVLGVARIAGIMAAKKNAELIPLCHILPLTKCSIEFELLDEKRAVRAECTAATVGKTGVEMEALTGVSVCLLTIYDMCKAIDKSMHIENIRLLEKDGGRSGHYVAQ